MTDLGEDVTYLRLAYHHTETLLWSTPRGTERREVLAERLANLRLKIMALGLEDPEC